MKRLRPGRKKGVLNKLPQAAKEAIIEALNAYGVNGTGEGGIALSTGISGI